jgi:6-phosphogluconolactonase
MTRQRPDLTVVPDAEALAQIAAERMLQVLAGRTGPYSVCLSGGSTPARLYQLLAQKPLRNVVPWELIHWFWGDERFVPVGDERSNAGSACRLFLRHSPAPAANIHPIPTTASDEQQAAQDYEAELRQFYIADTLDSEFPLFDIVLMGVGDDGHTASLFPGHPQLEETARWAVGVPQAGLQPFVPRVTLTFPVLASTRLMLFLVSGRGKRDILRRIAAGADVPAARAWSQGDLVWLVDRDAAPENADAR